jgi:hypothetical protein
MVQAERSSLISDDLGARLDVVPKLPCRFKVLGRAGDHILSLNLYPRQNYSNNNIEHHFQATILLYRC